MQGAASTTQGVVLVHLPLGKVLRMMVPMTLPARRVIVSSRNPSISPLIVLAVHFFPIQLNLPTEVVAEVVAEVAAEVTTEVTGMVLVVAVAVVAVAAADDVNTTVAALQARRTHLHSDSGIKRFTLNLHQ